MKASSTKAVSLFLGVEDTEPYASPCCDAELSLEPLLHIACSKCARSLNQADVIYKLAYNLTMLPEKGTKLDFKRAILNGGATPWIGSRWIIDGQTHVVEWATKDVVLLDVPHMKWGAQIPLRDFYLKAKQQEDA